MIARRLGIPRRIVAIIEGESLVNDGSALVLYKFAVLAVVTGSVSALQFSLSFAWTVAGGVGIGLALGWVIRQVRRRIDNPPVEITIALMTGYFTFIRPPWWAPPGCWPWSPPASTSAGTRRS